MADAENGKQFDQWRPCQPGELAAFGSGRPPVTRRRLAFAGAALAVFLSATAVAVVMQPDNAPSAEINCRDCKKLMPQYVAGELPRKVIRQVNRHVDHCDHCRQQLEKMQREQQKLEGA